MSNTTSAEANPHGSPATNQATTIGNRVDAFIANPARNPLAVVGIGILAGYLLARLLGR
jgi:hypothetical protein